jgi:sec-independent protein translocase protein TatA
MEMMILLVVVLLLFGNRLPSVMRSLGRGVVEFKKGVQGIEDDIDGSANKRIDEPPTSKHDEPAAKKPEEPVAKGTSENV